MKKNFILFLKKNRKKKFFIISGQNSYLKSNFAKIFKRELKQINKFIFFKKKYLPELRELKNITKEIRKYNPDIIIAVGGGCALDYAKIASVSSYIDNFDFKKFNKLKIKKKIKLIAIPTTAGSGSEVTEGAVLYENKIKFSCEHKLITPDDYYLIPDLVIGNSKKIKANSGFDALSQSIESILSNKANAKSIYFASKALKLIFNYFKKFYSSPTSRNANKMQLAANFAGKAICISKTTAPHAVSYPFTSHFKIGHGYAVSLTFNEFLKFNYENIDKAKNPNILMKKFVKIFKLTGTKNIYELLFYIDELKQLIKFEQKLSILSIDLTKNISKILKGINVKRLKNNPIELSVDDIKNILNQIK